MVVNLCPHADLREVEEHLRAHVLVVVHRRNREVALLVAQVSSLFFGTCGPSALRRLDEVVALVLVLIEPN
jgi:hypothetical protein